MAELTTIARPYAEAAFALAREAKALPVWSQMLRLPARVGADPRVAQALDNPALDRAPRNAAAFVCGEQLNAVAQLRALLVEGDRIAVLPGSRRCSRIEGLADGEVSAPIESAFPSERKVWRAVVGAREAHGEKVEGESRRSTRS